MPTVGVIAHFEAKPGQEARMEQFFQEGVKIVETQPASTQWFAFRISPTRYGAFAVFDSEADREALLAAGGPKLSIAYQAVFAERPSFEKVDILESRLASLTD